MSNLRRMTLEHKNSRELIKKSANDQNVGIDYGAMWLRARKV